MIISISRECGSGGHEIGEKLAEKLGITLLDKKSLIEEAKRMGKYDEISGFYDEKPMDSLLYAIAMTSSNNAIGKIPFEVLKELAKEKSFVIIGRCSNYVLQDFPDFTSVFITGNIQDRVRRTMEAQNIKEKKALEVVRQVDKKRSSYQKYYTDQQWADARNYQMTLNSSIVGIDQAVDLIIEFIHCKK